MLRRFVDLRTGFQRNASPFKIRQRVKTLAESAASKLVDMAGDQLAKQVNGPGRPHEKHKHWVPRELLDQSGNVKHENTQYVEIKGKIIRDGVVGALALASGRSADTSKFPLPQDPNDVNALFVPNGYIGLVRGQGAKSMIVDFTDGMYHFAPTDLKSLQKGDERLPPLQAKLRQASVGKLRRRFVSLKLVGVSKL